jgi:hypothetical protein
LCGPPGFRVNSSRQDLRFPFAPATRL